MTIFAQDGFVDTDATDLASHTPSIGTSWALASIASSHAAINGPAPGIRPVLAGGNAIYNISAAPPSADYTVQADLAFVTVTASDRAGVYARFNSGTNTYYRAIFTVGTGLVLIKVVSGVSTQLGSTYSGYSPSVNDVRTLQLIVSGTTLSVTLGGVTVIGPVTDSAIASVGSAALIMTAATASDSSGVQLRNFSAFTASGSLPFVPDAFPAPLSPLSGLH